MCGWLVLLLWIGLMFEYLMLMLVMFSIEGMLLDEICYVVVVW